MESFISTMETNALMGKNVARLIIDRMMDVDENATMVETLGGDGGQRLLQQEL